MGLTLDPADMQGPHDVPAKQTKKGYAPKISM
jgi:hypothetical protein